MGYAAAGRASSSAGPTSPLGPGLSIELNGGALARYRADGWPRRRSTMPSAGRGSGT